jgi:hypothetical protein
MLDFPFGALQNWAVANGEKTQLEMMRKQGEGGLGDQNKFFLTHTVLEILSSINTPESSRTNIGIYALLGHFGDENDEAGARLLTRWYERNALIYTALLRKIEPGDRVLVVYGAGHLGLLRRFVADDPTLKLRTLDEFVPGAGIKP